MSDRGQEIPGSCESTRRLLTSYLDDSLEEGLAARLRTHLAGCPSCREQAAEVDPTLLFLDLRATDLGAPFWRGFREDLHRRLEPGRPRWTAPFRSPAIAFVTAPLLMILMIGLSLVVLRPGWRGGNRHEGVPSPFSRPRGRAESGGPPPAAVGARTLGARPPGSGGEARPVLEEVNAPGARVYHFTVGGPGDETAIYLVVDESIDL